jgi:hypothetical protein
MEGTNNMSETAARLSAHKNTNLVTREQLAALAPVVGTDTFKPIPHIELILSLEQVLSSRGISILQTNAGVNREQFAMSKDGSRLFGVIDLAKNGIDGTTASLGLRTANNRSMSLQMIAGATVFVCDNMVFSGDTIMMKRKHTSGLNLMDELFIAMDKYERHYDKLRAEVNSLKGYDMTEIAAKVIMHDIFAKQIMPVRLFPEVSNEYFATEQRHVDFAPRTAWSLLNAFTEVAKQMPLTTRIKATQLIGKQFGALVG